MFVKLCTLTSKGPDWVTGPSGYGLAFRHDGLLARGTMRDSVQIWDPGSTSGSPVSYRGDMAPHCSDHVISVAWSLDGVLASCADSTIRLLNPDKTGKFNYLVGHDGGISSVAWSKNGWLASASDDMTIKLWDARTGECFLTLNGHSEPVVSVAWSPDGSRLASASDLSIKIWDAARATLTCTIEGHSEENTDCTCDDLLYSQKCEDVTGHSDDVTSVAWSPDGSLLASASMDCTIYIWDPKTAQCISTLAGHGVDNPNCVCSHGFWGYESNPNCPLRGHSSDITSIAWLQHDQLVSGSLDTTVKVWDTTKAECICTLDNNAHVDNVAIFGDIIAAASGSTATINMWTTQVVTLVLALKCIRTRVRVLRRGGRELVIQPIPPPDFDHAAYWVNVVCSGGLSEAICSLVMRSL